MLSVGVKILECEVDVVRWLLYSSVWQGQLYVLSLFHSILF